jgi:hypothetical protein
MRAAVAVLLAPALLVVEVSIESSLAVREALA